MNDLTSLMAQFKSLERRVGEVERRTTRRRSLDPADIADIIAALGAQGNVAPIGAAYVADAGPITTAVDINGPSINVAVGESVGCVMVCRIAETGGGATTGNVDADPGPSTTATFTTSSDTRCTWDMPSGAGQRTFVVSFLASNCTAAGVWQPQADVAVSSGGVSVEVHFFWMVF